MGGVMRQLSYLAPQLKKRGHEVSILALGESEGNWIHIWKHMSGTELVKIKVLPYRKAGNILTRFIWLVRATLGIRSILNKERAQILYAFEGYASRFVSCIAVSTISSSKLVWGVSGSGTGNVHRFGGNSRTVHASAIVNRWVSRFIPLIIANSEAGLANRLKMGYRCAKGLVIRNGIDTDTFTPNTKERELVRGEWNVSQNEVLIGVIARLDMVKGHITFLEAASFLRGELKGIRFVCVGDEEGPYKRRLKRLAHEAGLSDSLIWAGVREDIPSVLNAIDILCSSSYSEGSPNVILEAMACGKPCVVTDVGDSARIVDDCGIVVPPGDPVLLANGMRTVIENFSQLDPVKIRRRVIENFTIEKMVDETEKALQDVLGSV
jgi:glycosyltransferase involved in cell wall biosynthesis